MLERKHLVGNKCVEIEETYDMQELTVYYIRLVYFTTSCVVWRHDKGFLDMFSAAFFSRSKHQVFEIHSTSLVEA